MSLIGCDGESIMPWLVRQGEKEEYFDIPVRSEPAKAEPARETLFQGKRNNTGAPDAFAPDAPAHL
jgi:hypothetical protein